MPIPTNPINFLNFFLPELLLFLFIVIMCLHRYYFSDSIIYKPDNLIAIKFILCFTLVCYCAVLDYSSIDSLCFLGRLIFICNVVVFKQKTILTAIVYVMIGNPFSKYYLKRKIKGIEVFIIIFIIFLILLILFSYFGVFLKTFVLYSLWVNW